MTDDKDTKDTTPTNGALTINQHPTEMRLEPETVVDPWRKR